VRDYRRRGAIDTRARRRVGLPTEAGAFAYADADDRVSAQAAFAEVEELPPEQRAALELRVVDELKYGEIGERLDVNAITARTRVHRALKALRARTARSEG
jgi:RNA polymerase sigma-70 factor (ECF subfamily)